MEKLDKPAYRVLKNNYTILCTDLDARRVTTDSAKAGLISPEEKKAIWHSVAKDGVSAGVERLLDLLMSKTEERVFQGFIEVLRRHNDLRFWADCLKGKKVCTTQ